MMGAFAEYERKMIVQKLCGGARQRARVLLKRMLLTVFGLFAVTAMLVCYAMENRSPWFVFAFAISCVLASAYGFLQGAWPFGLVEAVWCIVALRRWRAAINTSP